MMIIAFVFPPKSIPALARQGYVLRKKLDCRIFSNYQNNKDRWILARLWGFGRVLGLWALPQTLPSVPHLPLLSQPLLTTYLECGLAGWAALWPGEPGLSLQNRFIYLTPSTPRPVPVGERGAKGWGMSGLPGPLKTETTIVVFLGATPCHV